MHWAMRSAAGSASHRRATAAVLVVTRLGMARASAIRARQGSGKTNEVPQTARHVRRARAVRGRDVVRAVQHGKHAANEGQHACEDRQRAVRRRPRAPMHA